jgi:hypothetical protein
MAVQTFSDLYLGGCQTCGADLEDWEWSEDDMVFRTVCTCGTEALLEPTAGIIEFETGDLCDDEDEAEDE